MPGLSVLVPCLNEAANLPGLVERLHAALQVPSLAPAEILLVDDGSADGTRTCVLELAGRYPGVRYLHHARTRGIPAAKRLKSPGGDR